MNHIESPALKVSVEYNISFANLKHLKIKYKDSEFDKTFIDFMSCSFQSNLESLSVQNISDCYNNYELFNILIKLQTKDAKIALSKFYIGYGYSLIDIIAYFSKANAVCFNQCKLDYGLYLIPRKFSIEEVEIKNLLFTKCSLEDIEYVKEVMTRSGLDKKIDKIIFEENYTERMKN